MSTSTAITAPSTASAEDQIAAKASRRWVTRLAVAGVVGLVMLVQVFYTTSGHMYGSSKDGKKAWWGQSHYYNALAEGFVQGELSLALRPSPELLAMPDPYDPAQNGGKKMHDAVLYKGADGQWRYYLYWGPVPGAIVAAVKFIGGHQLEISDQQLVTFFSFITVLFSALILLWMRENLMPETPLALLLLAVAMTGLMPTQLYFMTRPAVYEASIQGGQAFLIAGVFFALLGAGTRARWVWLLHAGLAWALAAGTRPSLVPAIGVLSLLIAFRVWSLVGFKAWRNWLPHALSLALPLIAAGVGWLTYNALRFGSALEFGFTYQLAGSDQRKLAELGYSSWRYVETNLFVYLACPLKIIGSFPFITANGSMPDLHLTHYVAPHHAFEPVAGLIWTTPLLYFAVVPVLIAALEWRPRRANTNLEKWVTMLLAGGAVVAFLPPLTLSGNTMRYLMDCLPLLALAAGLGIWQAARPFVRDGRTYYTLAGTLWVLSAWTLLVALAFGFGGYSESFKEHNPRLYQKLERTFSS
jgi:hypothetical protein